MQHRLFRSGMMNRNYNNTSTTIELDIGDIFWKLLMQWKALIIICIFMALLVPGAKYLKDKSAYDSAVKAQKKAEKKSSLPINKRIDEVLKKLPADKRADVTFLVQEAALLDYQKDYLDKSILLGTDPTSQRQLNYKYLFVNNSDMDLQTICSAYSTYLNRDAFVSDLRDALDLDSDLQYIYEILSTEYGSAYENNIRDSTKYGLPDSDSRCTLFTVSLIVPDTADAETVESVVDSSVASVHDVVSAEVGDHSLQKINVEDKFLYNKKADDARTRISSNINGLTINIESAKGKLTPEQKEAFETIVSLKSSADNATSSAKKNKVPAKPGFSKKYILFGFLLGGFLYVIIYVMLILLSKRLSSSSLVEKLTGQRLVGEIYRLKERHGLSALFTSPMIAKHRYGNKLNTEAQVSAIADVIDSVCIHNSVDSITLLTDGVCGRFSDDILRIADRCRSGKGIVREISILNADPVNEKMLNDISNAFFAVSSDTMIAELNKLTSLCRDYNIRTLGSIYLEEV